MLLLQIVTFALCSLLVNGSERANKCLREYAEDDKKCVGFDTAACVFPGDYIFKFLLSRPLLNVQLKLTGNQNSEFLNNVTIGECINLWRLRSSPGDSYFRKENDDVRSFGNVTMIAEPHNLKVEYYQSGVKSFLMQCPRLEFVQVENGYTLEVTVMIILVLPALIGAYRPQFVFCDDGRYPIKLYDDVEESSILSYWWVALIIVFALIAIIIIYCKFCRKKKTESDIEKDAEGAENETTTKTKKTPTAKSTPIAEDQSTKTNKKKQPRTEGSSERGKNKDRSAKSSMKSRKRQNVDPFELGGANLVRINTPDDNSVQVVGF